MEYFMSRYTRVLAGLLLALTLIACGAAVPSAVPSAAPASQAATQRVPATDQPAATQPAPAAADYPLTLTDGLGRKLTLASRPERIVSLAPSNTEILFAVGAGEAVVGVTKYCNFPEAARQIEQIGGFSAKTISIETIIALKPDVVFAGDESQQPVIDALEQAGIPVIALKAATFDDVYANIALAGKATGHVAEAEQVVAAMRDRVTAVSAKAATIPAGQRRSVFYEVFDEPLMTAGPGTFIGQMIELAGATNVFADASAEYPEISAEEVVARQPEVIVGPQSHADKLTADVIAARPGWNGLAAVRDNKIVIIDGDSVSRAGPRLAEALEALAASLYPDVFK
jgi:iron complex transport system substrate-binding protein